MKVQAFLGFANYYRWFIQDYAHHVKPLTELTKAKSTKSAKSVLFSWEKQQQEAFDGLKRVFQEAPILVQFDHSHPTLIETDALNQAISGVLSQGYPDPPCTKADKLV